MKRSLLTLSAATFVIAACGESSNLGPGAGGSGGSGAGGGLAGASGSDTAGGSGAGVGGGSGGTGTQAGAPSVAGAAGQAGAGASSVGGEAGGSAAGLVVTPSELVFGAVQQTQAAPQVVTLENTGAAAITLESVALDAAAAGSELGPGSKQELEVRFNPSGVQLFESGVVIKSSGAQLESRVALFGLGTRGLEGDNEPFLQIVLTTLGFDVDVGGDGLLSTTTPLVGSEISAQRFEASGAEPIELVPVARYSPQEPIPFGYYTASAEIEVGVISADQFQALHPGTEPGSQQSFAPPGAPFGIFTISETHSTYTEDAKNAGNQVQHAVRSYPLKDRAGTAVPNAYLVCFEEAANGDYQDYVFALRNVRPVP